MRIGGFQKFSLLDYPGKMAAIIFTQGCNFRCGYCYNLSLMCPEHFNEPIDEKEILGFLELRKGKLEGVVVTGGEPTIQLGLDDFLSKIKAMGYAIKLDTNGNRPDVLARLIESKLVDFIAMDIKTSLDRYEQVVGVSLDTQNIKKSIDLIRQSGLKHQFRTTLVKSHCSVEDINSILSYVQNSHSYVLQAFRPSEDVFDVNLLSKEQYTHWEIQELRSKFQRGV